MSSTGRHLLRRRPLRASAASAPSDAPDTCDWVCTQLPRRGVASAEDSNDEDAYCDWQEAEDSPESPTGSASGDASTDKVLAQPGIQDAHQLAVETSSLQSHAC